MQELIKRRRAQMLVHSYLYYQLDTNIVSDHKWQEWADELTKLQEEYPEPIGFYDEAFVDWDGSTGYHLPRDRWVMGIAFRLIRYEQERTGRKLLDDGDEEDEDLVTASPDTECSEA